MTIHGNATIVKNLHRPWFVSETDPAAETGQAAYKVWLEVDGSGVPVALHSRDAANADWDTLIVFADLVTAADITAAIAAVLDGATFTGDVVVPDEAYDATGWDGDLSVPTKNAVRDKIEAVVAGAPAAHKTSHENGGADEISVAGLSGLLADGQTPLTHATSHQSGGADAIKLDDLAAPDDNTDLNATSSAHGLAKKLGAANTMLTSDGTNQQWVNIVTHAQITEGAAMDADMGNRFSGAFYLSADLAGNRTITVSNCPNGGAGSIVGAQDGTGGRTLTTTGITSLIVGGTGGSDVLPIPSAIDANWIIAFVRINDIFYWTVGEPV